MWGATPKGIPGDSPASLPLASNVANVGSSPVRMFEFAASPAFAFSLVKLQNTFTFPANVNAQPLDICIVRPCALAVALTPNARPNNNSVRRFIRESLLGSLSAILPLVPCEAPARTRRRQVSPSGSALLPPVMLVWLLTYDSCDSKGKRVHLLVRASRSCCSTPGAFRTSPTPAFCAAHPLPRANVCPQEWPPGTAAELI